MSRIPDKMSGVLLLGHGGPEMLEYRNDILTPQPGPNDVVIRVSAAGVNNTDINTRTAWYSKGDNEDHDASWSGQALNFPLIQGADVCGKIVSVGDHVDKGRIGERVLIEPCIREVNNNILDKPWYFGSECNGGFAQYTVVASRHAHAINSTYEDVELASFPCSYSTAENMLTRSRVTSEERVLITGASGGVGSAAVQLAKARGAEVIAVTSPLKAITLQEIGADQTLSRDDDYVELLGKDSIDVVLDLVAGQKWPSLLDTLCPGGRYAVAGAIGGSIVEFDVRTLYLKDLRFFGCTVLEPEVFRNLMTHIENGRVKPLVAETYPLKEIGKAQTSFESKSHIGKIVLKIEGEDS
ncbi:MAG: alcohol dehydrogenase family protein [Rhodospirillales bacterium]|nr:alcohol dehydrogenase family protein [Rhodospirillales bacterium]